MFFKFNAPPLVPLKLLENLKWSIKIFYPYIIEIPP